MLKLHSGFPTIEALLSSKRTDTIYYYGPEEGLNLLKSMVFLSGYRGDIASTDEAPENFAHLVYWED